MAHNRTFWQDHVTEFSDRYKEVNNDDGTISHVPVEGEVIQQGTPQNARNFNALEDGAFSAGVIGAEAMRVLLLHQRDIKGLSSETGQISLTNSQKYPFNNSVKTVVLKQKMDTTAYTVEADVLSSDGEVGHIVITDKQQNGFKIAYTGSAKSATVKFFVKGGLF